MKLLRPPLLIEGCAPIGDVHFMCGFAGNPVADLHPHQGEARLPAQLLSLPAAPAVRAMPSCPRALHLMKCMAAPHLP